MRKTLGNCIAGSFCLVFTCGIFATRATGQADTQAWQKPTLVTLHLRDVSAQQALESVEQQTGLKLQAQNKVAADRLMLTPVNIDAIDQPFWAVMQKICEAANVVPQSATGQGGGFVMGVERGGWSAPFVSVQGPFAIALIRVVQNASIRFGESDPPLPDAVSLALQICPEPKVPVQTVTHIHITKCVDESGFPVAADEPRSFQIFGWPSQQSVDLRPTGSARIALIEGEVSVGVESGRQPLEISNILTARGVVRMVEGFRIRLNQCLKQGARGRQFVLQFVVLKEAHNDVELKQFVDRLLRSRPELLDGEGKKLIPEVAQNSSRPTADGLQLRISFNRGLGPEPSTGEPLKLAWDVPTGSAEISIPFSFKDIPLPRVKAPLVAGVKTKRVTIAASAPVDYSKRIEALVQQLGDVTAERRQNATIALELLPPDAFKQLEAASKHGTLPPSAAGLLKVFLERARPLQDARLRRAKIVEKGQNWDAETAQEAYDQVGVHDSKWDELARRAIQLYCHTSEQSPPTEASAALKETVEAGCVDPMILFMAAHIAERSGGDPHQVLERYRQAHEGMRRSRYPAYRKVWLAIRYIALDYHTANAEAQAKHLQFLDQNMVDVLRRLRQEMLLDWPAAAKEGGPPDRLYDTASEVFFWSGADDQGSYNRISPVVEAALASDLAPLLIKGHFYTSWGFRARGQDTADKVSEEGWKLMHERLGMAEQAYQQAYQKDPNDPRAPTAMLDVELGLGKGRQVMEMWFKRAIAADPDNVKACAAKLYYLEPKWYGTAAEMLKFGNECFDSGKWRAKIPMLLADAHRRLSEYENNPAEYLRRPEVWRDIERVYEPYLRVVPDDVEARSDYCAFACRAEKWDVARSQFAILGANVVPRLFGYGSIDELNEYRRKAQVEKP